MWRRRGVSPRPRDHTQVCRHPRCRWGHARLRARVAHRGTAHVQTTHKRRPYPQLEPGMTQPQHLFIPADAGEKVTLPGIEITIKVTSASTGHAFAVFEEVTRPGAGLALHVHRHQFEIFRFLEGTYEVKVGDKVLTAEPGAVAVVLPGHAHAFRNSGAREARLQSIIMPGASSDEF